MHVLIIPSWYKNSQNQLEGIFFEEQAQLVQRIANDKIGLVYCHIWRLSSKINLSKKVDLLLRGRVVKETAEIIPVLRSEVLFIPLLQSEFMFGLGKYINHIVHKLNSYRLKKRYDLLFKHYLKDMGSPDLLHIQSAKTAGPIGLHLSKKLNIPYIVTEHWSYLATPKLALLPRNLITVYQHSKQNYAVSSGFCDSLSQLSGTYFKLFPNFIDTDYFRPSISEITDTIIIASIGNLVEIKNFKLLIQAFSILASTSNRKIELKIGGDGPELPSLKALVKQNNIETSVQFLGQLNRSQVRAVMRLSTIFVLPSTLETFGIVLIESLSCGTPVVAVRSWGPETIITSNDIGYLCENNADSMSICISTMLDNIDTFSEIVLRKHVINNYSKDILAKRMRDAYSRHCQRNIIEIGNSE